MDTSRTIERNVSQLLTRQQIGVTASMLRELFPDVLRPESTDYTEPKISLEYVVGQLVDRSMRYNLMECRILESVQADYELDLNNVKCVRRDVQALSELLHHLQEVALAASAFLPKRASKQVNATLNQGKNTARVSKSFLASQYTFLKEMAPKHTSIILDDIVTSPVPSLAVDWEVLRHEAGTLYQEQDSIHKWFSHIEEVGIVLRRKHTLKWFFGNLGGVGNPSIVREGPP